MKKYLLLVEDEKAWNQFAKHYKKKGLGSNLDEAIMELIRRSGKDDEK